MTSNQRITLMADWWPRACKAQGWRASDRELRLAELSKAVKRELTSASDLNSTTDIDAVKAHLAALADNLAPMLKHETPDEDDAVRWRWLVREEMRKLAALGIYATDYTASIIRDKFASGACTHVREKSIDDLTLDQLKQLKFTLSRVVREKKKQAKPAPIDEMVPF